MSKVKVIGYAADGNTVVQPYKEVTPFAGVPGVFTSVHTDGEYTDLIFCFYEVYIKDGSYRTAHLQQENSKELIVAAYTGYLDKITTGPGWVGLDRVELFKQLGRDTGPLMLRREQVKAARARKDQERRQAEAEEARMYAEQVAKQLSEALEQLKAGIEIDKEKFLALIKLHGVKIPIRTIGMLNRLPLCTISADSIHYRKYSGDREPQSFSEVRKAAKLLASINLTA